VIHKVVHRVPLIGPSFDKLAKAAVQKITNALGAAEREVDSAIGWTWHNMSTLIRWTMREIEQLAYASVVAAVAMRLHISRRQAAKLIQAFLHPIRTLQWIERQLLNKLRHETIVVRQAVGTAVLPRLGTVEGELAHVIEWDIPRLRARERALARRVERLWKWVRAHEKIVVSTAFVGAVSVALARLGGGWIRCKNWRRIGRHVCGLPATLIEDLLGLALGFELLVDPEEIAKVALDVESAFEGVFEQIAG